MSTPCRNCVNLGDLHRGTPRSVVPRRAAPVGCDLPTVEQECTPLADPEAGAQPQLTNTAGSLRHDHVIAASEQQQAQERE